MSRRNVIRLPDDPVARLRRLLGIIEANLPDVPRDEPTPRHLEPRPLSLTFGQMMAFLDEREARRQARHRKPAPRLLPDPDPDLGL